MIVFAWLMLLIWVVYSVGGMGTLMFGFGIRGFASVGFCVELELWLMIWAGLLI